MSEIQSGEISEPLLFGNTDNINEGTLLTCSGAANSYRERSFRRKPNQLSTHSIEKQVTRKAQQEIPLC